ncbi:MAG: ABC transporter permease, partial [Acidimicrobiales bacterium]|nr:ABC transporter permease [Acidimicrobiales bacterium]
MASRHRLLLRWSWRDLRRRKGLVVLTAVIIAIGTGTYGGLGGSSAWRIESQDASYAQLGYHDLRVRLPDNVDVAAGALVEQIAPLDGVDAVEERLVVPTQVDASTADDVVLVPGELVGLAPDATIDQLHVASGTAEGWGTDQVVLEQKFVDDRGLPDTGTIAIGGGRELRYEGTGVTPEHFRVQGATGAQLTGAYGYAVVYLPLAAAQELSGREGRVDEAVVRLAPEADADAVATEVEAALADEGATVETRDDDTVRRTLYADARNDEKMWTALSLLILAGAAFAAFNLVTRMVEAERREIGVGMALGAPVARLAVRPLLVGLQIAVLGVALGVVVGLGAGHAMRDLLVDFLPLPTWHT